MIDKMLIRIFCVYLLSFSLVASAQSRLSLALHDGNLAEVIRHVAKFLEINVMLSPSIQGVVNVHWQNVSPDQAFDLLLNMHHLAKLQMGNIYYIAPQQELINHQQEKLNWQQLRDEAQPLITQRWHIHYRKADDIVRVVHDEHHSFLSKRAYVSVDPRLNTVIIQDTQKGITAADRLIKALDVPMKQIMIEARLVNIDHDCERELGIRFAILPPHTKNHPYQTKSVDNTVYAGYSMATLSLADKSLLDIKLAALERAGHAELISSPRLFTTNHQAASIEAGEEVPYQEVSEGGGTAIAFKKAVVGLNVTPQLLPKNQVLLDLTINQDRPSNRFVQGVPTISTRRITTHVLVPSEHTVVLGGIYEENNDEVVERIPLISQIPLLGKLFEQKNRRTTKRELLIFVTPKMIA